MLDTTGNYTGQIAQSKKLWPGLWDVGVGGHVDAGEFGYQAIIREATEELGLQLLHFK